LRSTDPDTTTLSAAAGVASMRSVPLFTWSPAIVLHAAGCDGDETPTLNVKAKFVSTEGESERGPDFRIIAGTNVEFGAAWRTTARETQREYLSVKAYRELSDSLHTL
jgi:hypothetical protein